MNKSKKCGEFSPHFFLSQRAYFRKRKISFLNKKLNFLQKKIKKDVSNKNLFIYDVFNVIDIKKYQIWTTLVRN